MQNCLAESSDCLVVTSQNHNNAAPFKAEFLSRPKKFILYDVGFDIFTLFTSLPL